MDDLVSRQDVIDALMNDADWADAIPTIKSLPSSEPNIKCIAQIRIDRDDMENLVNGIIEKIAEPKTGKWVWDDKGYFHCDQCGKKPNDQTRVTNFCPNCGSFNGGGEGD